MSAARGWMSRFKQGTKRVAKRLLWPFFGKQLSLLYDLQHRVSAIETAQKHHTHIAQKALALGWDHVALVRRLATLEAHVDALLARGEGVDSPLPTTMPMTPTRVAKNNENPRFKVG